jgi:hypothetical protein
MQTAKCGPEEPGGGHANLGVATDNRDIGHQRHLEPAAQRIPADLPHRDLRKAHQVVVEAERLAVHCQTPPLTRAALRRFVVALAIPAVRVVHVRAGAEHSLGATQQHHGDVVVFGDAIQVARDGVTHRRVVRIALAWVVQRDGRDPLLGIHIEEHAIVGTGHLTDS